MNIIGLLLPLALLSALALWSKQTIIFMLVGGLAIIMGCYAPDILNNGVTDNLSLTVGLVFMTYGLTCEGLAYRALFKGGE